MDENLSAFRSKNSSPASQFFSQNTLRLLSNDLPMKTYSTGFLTSLGISSCKFEKHDRNPVLGSTSSWENKSNYRMENSSFYSYILGMSNSNIRTPLSCESEYRFSPINSTFANNNFFEPAQLSFKKKKKSPLKFFNYDIEARTLKSFSPLCHLNDNQVTRRKTDDCRIEDEAQEDEEGINENEGMEEKREGKVQKTVISVPAESIRPKLAMKEEEKVEKNEHMVKSNHYSQIPVINLVNNNKVSSANGVLFPKTNSNFKVNQSKFDFQNSKMNQNYSRVHFEFSNSNASSSSSLKGNSNQFEKEDELTQKIIANYSFSSFFSRRNSALDCKKENKRSSGTAINKKKKEKIHYSYLKKSVYIYGDASSLPSNQARIEGKIKKEKDENKIGVNDENNRIGRNDKNTKAFDNENDKKSNEKEVMNYQNQMKSNRMECQEHIIDQHMGVLKHLSFQNCVNMQMKGVVNREEDVNGKESREMHIGFRKKEAMKGERNPWISSLFKPNRTSRLGKKLTFQTLFPSALNSESMESSYFEILCNENAMRREDGIKRGKCMDVEGSRENEKHFENTQEKERQGGKEKEEGNKTGGKQQEKEGKEQKENKEEMEEEKEGEVEETEKDKGDEEKEEEEKVNDGNEGEEEDGDDDDDDDGDNGDDGDGDGDDGDGDGDGDGDDEDIRKLKNIVISNENQIRKRKRKGRKDENGKGKIETVNEKEKVNEKENEKLEERKRKSESKLENIENENIMEENMQTNMHNINEEKKEAKSDYLKLLKNKYSSEFRFNNDSECKENYLIKDENVMKDKGVAFQNSRKDFETHKENKEDKPMQFNSEANYHNSFHNVSENYSGGCVGWKRLREKIKNFTSPDEFLPPQKIARGTYSWGKICNKFSAAANGVINNQAGGLASNKPKNSSKPKPRAAHDNKTVCVKSDVELQTRHAMNLNANLNTVSESEPRTGAKPEPGSLNTSMNNFVFLNDDDPSLVNEDSKREKPSESVFAKSLKYEDLSTKVLNAEFCGHGFNTLEPNDACEPLIFKKDVIKEVNGVDQNRENEDLNCLHSRRTRKKQMAFKT